jgi:hypothetical protein|tara:strand:- start:61 stop:846 length:786 start_codon:yes stop_codon:yes gene_type:complete
MVVQKIKFSRYIFSNRKDAAFIFGFLVVFSIFAFFTFYGEKMFWEQVWSLLFFFGGFLGLYTHFVKNFISRSDSSNTITFGLELSSYYRIKEREIPIRDLFCWGYTEESTNIDWIIPRADSMDLVILKENGNTISTFEGNTDDLKSILPEIFEIDHIILYNQTRKASAHIDVETNSRPQVSIHEAEIVDGRLVGYISKRSKLGKGSVKSSTIFDMVFDEDGTTRVETKNSVYVVEPKGWAVLPSNYPSNTEGDWWGETSEK